MAALLCVAVHIAGPAHAQDRPHNAFGFRWQEKGLADHPLVGRVWSPATQAFIDPASLADGLREADLVLLGEVHDIADAHALQGWAIRRRAARQPAPGVVFEHIRTDQHEALARLDEFDRMARRPATVHDLFRFLDWKTSGWPPESKFLPLFTAVFYPRLPIYPANPPRQQVMAVARGDATALSGEDRARMKLDVLLEGPLADALGAELKDSHCGVLPDTALPRMSMAQRYRDAAFADAMLAAADKHGAAILVAGNGHVRTDRAVPWYLRQRANGHATVSVMLLEVENGNTDPAAYVPRDPAGTPAVDHIVFTPRAERPDPCESLRHSGRPKP